MAAAATAVITAHGELDAANAEEFVDYSLRHAAHIDRLVLDLSGVDFFGTAGFSALHTLNVRCAAEKIEWALAPSAAVTRCFGSAILIRPCRSATASRRRCRRFGANRSATAAGLEVALATSPTAETRASVRYRPARRSASA